MRDELNTAPLAAARKTRGSAWIVAQRPQGGAWDEGDVADETAGMQQALAAAALPGARAVIFAAVDDDGALTDPSWTWGG